MLILRTQNRRCWTGTGGAEQEQENSEQEMLINVGKTQI